jgi:hypothetical protein
MRQTDSARRRQVEGLARHIRGRLFKEDRPRAIDRYIDYFGGASTAAEDPCGGRLFEALANCG